MASFFREVGRINGRLHVAAMPISNVAGGHDPAHRFNQYDDEQDVDNIVRWLFSGHDEEEADHGEQNNVIYMRNCPSCIQRLEAGQSGLCLGCTIVVAGGMVLFMFSFFLPIFLLLIFL